MADTRETKQREGTRSYSSSRNAPMRRHFREGESLSSSGLDRWRPASSRFQASPLAMMRRFAEDMDRMFSDYGFGGSSLLPFDPWSSGSNLESSMWAPEIETFRRGEKLVVRADLPGMNKDNVNVEIEDNTLILSGERQDEYNEERDDFYRSERSYGRFYRAVPLPEGVDPNACNAQFKDGVLEVTLNLPKQSGRERKRVDIH